MRICHQSTLYLAPWLLVFALFYSQLSRSEDFIWQKPPSYSTDEADETLTSAPPADEEAVGITIEPTLTTEQIEESLGHEQLEDGSWVDSSHEYIGTKADDLAIYLDRFFGSPLEDLESADSTLRFITRFQWDEDRGDDVRFRLRGNVQLPRLNKRLSLVFNAEDEEFRSNYNASDDDRNEVGLQLNARDSRRSRFDFTLSVSSGLNLKPGVRYRFKEDLADWGRFRYTARGDYSDRNRFRQRHTVELDYLTGETSLLRWANKVEHGQRSEGVEWGSYFSWRYGYSLDSALAVVLGVSGKTEPDIPDFVLDEPPWMGRAPEQDPVVSSYGLVIKLRNRLYKDWLYVEFEPGYALRKRHNYEDRHGVFFGRINLEINFNRGRERQRRVERDRASTDVALAPEG
jgi:hypothetical protein